MLLGIISDTHGHVAFARSAVEMLAALEVDEVIHCGDIGSPAIVRLLSAWPTHFVLGNCDNHRDEAELLTEMDRHGHTLYGHFGELTRCARRIAFLHGDDSQRLAETIALGQYDLVCYGHTHVAREERHGPTVALNPGALFRAEEHSIAVVDLPALTVTRIVV